MAHHYINHVGRGESGHERRHPTMTPDFALEHVSIAPEDGPETPPAVVLLHGRGADEEDLVPVGRQLPGGVHLLSVRAPTRLGPGFTWYDIDLSAGGLHASQPDPDDFDESLSLLSAFLETAIAEYGLDDEQIGLLGFSQGAILALGALAEQPERYAWIVGLHGYLPARYDVNDLADAAGTAVFLGGGTQDEVIPATRAEDAANRLEAAGVEVTFRTYPIGHGIGREEAGDLIAWVDSQLTNGDADAV